MMIKKLLDGANKKISPYRIYNPQTTRNLLLGSEIYSSSRDANPAIPNGVISVEL